MDISLKIIAVALVGALGIAASASAQEASSTPTTPPAAPAAASTESNQTTSATTASSTAKQTQQSDGARPSPDMIKDASQFGYKLKLSTKTGTYVFCKTDSQIGTRFQTTKCLPPDMLAQVLDQQKRDQNYARTQLGQLACGMNKQAGC